MKLESLEELIDHLRELKEDDGIDIREIRLVGPGDEENSNPMSDHYKDMLHNTSFALFKTQIRMGLTKEQAHTAIKMAMKSDDKAFLTYQGDRLVENFEEKRKTRGKKVTIIAVNGALMKGPAVDIFFKAFDLLEKKAQKENDLVILHGINNILNPPDQRKKEEIDEQQKSFEFLTDTLDKIKGELQCGANGMTLAIEDKELAEHYKNQVGEILHIAEHCQQILKALM